MSSSTTTTTTPGSTTTTVPALCNRPGHGYGDKNHVHCGPPGHDSIDAQLIGSLRPLSSPGVWFMLATGGLAFTFLFGGGKRRRSAR
jgi:hypothetical protein